MIDKNLSYTCKIIDFSVSGDGVAKIDSYPLFVKGAVPGDVIELKPTKLNKSYGFARIIRIITPSPDRCNTKCKSFPRCGGCSFMHVNYECEKNYKSDFVLSNIKKLGGYSEDDFIYEQILGAEDEYFYRNKAQFPVRISQGRAVCGFYEAKSHSVVNCDYCYIQNRVINEAVKLTMDFINKYKISVYNEEKHQGLIRHIYSRYSSENKSLMIVLVTNGRTKINNIDILIDSLKPLGLNSLVQNVNTQKTNVILGDKNIILYGNEYIHMQVDELIFKVSPHSFFQVNTNQMKRLYAKALEYAELQGDETVFDLYCGVGSISLFMAKKAEKVIGVEIVPQAIDNAKENAALSGVTNTEFHCGDCTEVVGNLIAHGNTADVVVVDPPRKGCDEKLLKLINSISPKKIVYVSCNSATLGRDLAKLKEYGYILKKACAADLFPKTVHVETVALLSQLIINPQ